MRCSPASTGLAFPVLAFLPAAPVHSTRRDNLALALRVASCCPGDAPVLAYFVYSGRNGNGDEKSGYGWKYRGRGLMQLTFRDNYAAFAKDTGVDAVNHPELLEQPKVAVYSAAWFWNKAHLNPYADRGSYKSLTLRINAEALGYKERERYRKRAVALLTRYPWDNWLGLC